MPQYAEKLPVTAFLYILGCVMGILVHAVTLVEKGAAYIQRRKERTEKDPSASFLATDGSEDERKER